MADRTSARLFGRLFTYIAENESLTRESLVTHLWEMQKKCDFGPSQMDCDEALIKLGLAREQPIDEDGCVEVEYGPVAKESGCSPRQSTST